MNTLSYSEKLLDPRWQKKRLEIFNRDNWTCQFCGTTTVQLEIHHIEYIEGKQPWQYDNDSLITLCHNHHKEETVRFKHESYLLKSLYAKGFLAVDILALSCLLNHNTKFAEFLRRKIREFAKEEF